jgi:hypothetical protein
MHAERVGYKVWLIVCMYADSRQFIDFAFFPVCQMDCCHSGTAMDLPYEINATQSKMHANEGFSLGSLLEEPAAAIACCACLGLILFDLFSDG